MSSYAHLYLVNNDIATELYSGSRSSKFYDLLDDAGAPYEKVAPLTITKVEGIIGRLEADFNFCNEQIKESENMISTIASMSDDIDVRLEKIGDYRGYISEYKEDLEEIIYWKNAFCFIKNMLEEIASNIEYEYVTDNIWLGMGIESGTKPTKEDFVLPSDFYNNAEKENE